MLENTFFKIVSTSLLLLTLSLSIGQAATVEVTLAAAPTEGAIVCMLFDTADTFGDLRDPKYTQRFPADGRDTFQLTDITAGDYALLVYHDENNNGRLDENFLGIPREPVGFSNGYRPKGPPSYSRARFTLQTQDVQTFTITLERPLGQSGRIGVGIGMVGKSSPYAQYDGQVTQLIPAVTYTSARVQIFGPQARLGLLDGENTALALEASYRIKAYEEEKSPLLTGMGDRKSTLMLGPAVKFDLPQGIDLTAGYQHDMLDEIRGGMAQIQIDRSFQWGIARLSPSVGLHWLSEDIAQHEFGVPTAQAISGRPAYHLGDTLNLECGLGAFVELTRDWLVVGGLNLEFLDRDIRRSPIVDEDILLSFFAAVNYVF